MNNWFYTSLVGLFLQAAQLQAQPIVGAQHISYRRDVPKNVVRAVPRGAKRWFWGTVTPKPGSAPIGIQIYESKPGLTLELWQKNSKSFTRVNHVDSLPNYYGGPVPLDAKFSADFYWLDRAQKTMPVLVITEITYHNLMPGTFEQINVIPLSSDWKSKPSVQTFFDGPSNSGESNFSVAYNDADQLELGTYSFDSSGITISDTYAWDGKRLSAVPGKRITTDVFKDRGP